MRFSSAIASLVFSTSVIAATDSTQKECQDAFALQKFVSFAQNASLVATITNNNATEIAEIQAKASDASVKLKTLESNTTLMAACASIDAQDETEAGCDETFVLQKFIQFSSNTTAVADATQNNATKIADIKTLSSEAAVQLATLTSNKTLQAACPAVEEKDECDIMNKLEKTVDIANNATKLDKITNNNATKIAEFKAFASKAATKLTAFTSNSTLVAACNSNTVEDGIQIGSGKETTSAAQSLKSLSTEGLMWSTVLVAVVGVIVL